MAKTRTHLWFTEDELKRGRETLQRLGIPVGAPWICIHNRDKVYLDESSNGRFEHHDYRNFSIHSMTDAIGEFVRRGYYVVRMGSLVEEKMGLFGPKVIDYASSDLRNDFDDIYLLANCVAYFGSDSGISSVPFIFRRPCFFINFSSTLTNVFMDHNTGYPFIFKRLWHKELGRYLSLREVFEAGLTGVAESRLFDLANVRAVSNTSVDLAGFAMEVDERLRGRWISSSEDEELQQKYWEILTGYYPKSRLSQNPIYIGSDFLRNNADLLN